MRLIWSPRSRLDRQHILETIASDSIDAALRLDETFVSLADSLLAFPRKGRKGRLQGTRELVVHRNYLIVYRAEPNGIEIVRIIHAARRWP